MVGFIALLGVLALSLVMLVGDDKKLEDDLPDKQNLTEQTVAAQPKESPGFIGKTLHRADTWKARSKEVL